MTGGNAKLLRRAGLMVLLGLLSGCGMEMPESRMSEVATMAPGRWGGSQEARAGVDRYWIERFRDPNLVALVNEGMANNADMRVASERVEQALQSARLAGVSFRPTVSASLNGDRQKRQFFGFPGGGGDFLTTTYGTSLDVRWELDLWGRARAGQSAEVAEWAAQGQDYRAARASLAGQVAKAWFALGEANDQIALADDSLNIRRKTEAAIKDRFDLALEREGGTAAQFRLAQSDTAAAQATLELWRGERERVLREIEVLVGRYPAGENLSQSGLSRIPKNPPSGLPSGLLLRRPDIQAAERRFAGAGKRLREAELAVYPNFTLTGSLGNTSESLSDVLKSQLGSWALGAGLVQPILTGGEIKHAKAQRESLERQRLAELQRAVLVAFGEVESALVADRAFAKRVSATADAARLAREAALAAETDFGEGTGDILTLLAAQDRSASTASTLVTLRRQQLDNRVNLHLALGGDFEVRRKDKS